MSTDTTQLDVTELNNAANVLRHIAIRRFEQGFNVQALNTLADCVLHAMHFIASEPVGKGTKMENDHDTPTDDRAVLKRDERPSIENKFLVGRLDNTVLMTALTPRRLSFEEALNLAAHLLLIADEPVAFDHVNISGAVLSVEFVDLLRAVQLVHAEQT